MRFSLGKAAVRVSPLYLFLLLCISVFDYTGILLQAFVASLLHEMGHLLCLLLQRRPVCALDFTVAGIRLDRGTDYCPSPADIPVYLAGRRSTWPSAWGPSGCCSAALPCTWPPWR